MCNEDVFGETYLEIGAMDSKVETPEQNSNKLRRAQAAEFLTRNGWPISESTLACYAVKGTGPAYRKWSRIPLYSPEDLLRWAEGRASKPVRSSSELVA
ncbi:helix-turn-helix transcriptional regulator [Dongia sp. agr-C8]